MDDYNNPKEGKTYISPSLKGFGSFEKQIRIASKVISSPDSYAFGTIKDEIVIRHKKNAQSYIKAKFIEDNRGIFVLSIQGFTVATDKPHNASFSFVNNEIDTLLNFIKSIQQFKLENCKAVSFSDEHRNTILSDTQMQTLIRENEELLQEVLKSEITKDDIVSIAYRKKQITVFSQLLENQEYFLNLLQKKNCTNESLWQKFFEKNNWIFGYGLGYIFLSNLNDKKLEQIVQGYSLNNRGKRVDALMKTRGLISSLCFIEIKTHLTSLLDNKPYRAGCWSPSKELSGAVAQIQGTVASAIDTLSNRIMIEDGEGNPTGEEIYNYQPKSFLVIGSLSEFITEFGINKEKLRSFELYRKNIINPEIITFDELYERAKYIVINNESFILEK
ncbi:DUF4263 domain-containing protein [Dysgonomonas capnocytophagoides]|uniref:DUF4263 domain-containing protein n=1 Tax=Dysgonomonas capnocytophagoides TaxID=45254 RepID=A0A4Y8LDF8_9BACT|nr:Shedu immune nuclease family protein [Dysgonomonas capnocytophagoides]TFD99080.1 DUF4263 domain-containing protein [Dysgonomonas capnocytophagoides]